MDKQPYNDKLDAEDQITMKEEIAGYILDEEEFGGDDEVAADMGRDILYLVLRKFRPDLFV